MIRSLGIDLGQTWGWCRMTQPFPASRRMVTMGEASLSSSRVRASSLGRIFSGFGRWLRRELTDFTPTVVVYEVVNFNRGFSYIPGMTAILLDELEARGIPYEGVSIKTLKKLGAGNGNASKQAMIDAAIAEWQGRLAIAEPFDGRRKLTDNMADAIWCAHHGIITSVE